MQIIWDELACNWFLMKDFKTYMEKEDSFTRNINFHIQIQSNFGKGMCLLL